jgi:hypothetical protein
MTTTTITTTTTTTTAMTRAHSKKELDCVEIICVGETNCVVEVNCVDAGVEAGAAVDVEVLCLAFKQNCER